MREWMRVPHPSGTTCPLACISQRGVHTRWSENRQGCHCSSRLSTIWVLELEYHRSAIIWPKFQVLIVRYINIGVPVHFWSYSEITMHHLTLGGCKKKPTVSRPCYNLILFSSVYIMSLGPLGAPRMSLELELSLICVNLPGHAILRK